MISNIKMKCCVISLILSSCILFRGHPILEAQIEMPAVLSGKTTINEIIKNFRDAMDSLIAKAGGESRLTLLRAYQLVDSLIHSLELTYKDALKTTFEELDNQQRKALEDTNKLLGELQETTRQPLIEASNIAKDALTTLNNIAFWVKGPIVTNYTPEFISPAFFGGDVRVHVQGFKFRSNSNGVAPTIKVNDTTIPADEFTDNELSFIIPRSKLLITDTKTEFLRIVLKFAQKSSWLQWLLWKQNEPIAYPLLSLVLPEQLGSFRYEQKLREEIQETQRWESPLVDTNKTRTQNKYVHDCFEPPAGWKFDPSSAQFIRNERHGWWVNEAYDSRYNEGRVVWHEDVKTPERICVGALAAPLEHDTWAQTIAQIAVNIVRKVPTERTLDNPLQKLDWRQDITVKLDQNAVSSILYITLFDDITRVVAATDTTTLPFMKVSPDTRNHITVLQPMRKWQNN